MSEDRTRATALLIAERHLIKMGWKFTMKDVGDKAGEILAALPPPPNNAKVAEGEK